MAVARPIGEGMGRAIFGSGRLGFLPEPLGSNRFAPVATDTDQSRRTSPPSRVWTPS